MRIGAAILLASAMILPAALAHAQQSAATVTSTVQPAGQPKPAKAPASSSHGPGLNLGSHDSNAPINMTSDNFVGDLTTKIGTYIGNVIVTQADYKLRSDKLKVDVVDGKPTKFTATGNVVFDVGNRGHRNRRQRASTISCRTSHADRTCRSHEGERRDARHACWWSDTVTGRGPSDGAREWPATGCRVFSCRPRKPTPALPRNLRLARRIRLHGSLKTNRHNSCHDNRHRRPSEPDCQARARPGDPARGGRQPGARRRRVSARASTSARWCGRSACRCGAEKWWACWVPTAPARPPAST